MVVQRRDAADPGRHERDMLYSPTKSRSRYFRSHVRSYRLPLTSMHPVEVQTRCDRVWHHARAGIPMKDAYSFDIDADAARQSTTGCSSPI